jgi:hypothetical protein
MTAINWELWWQVVLLIFVIGFVICIIKSTDSGKRP